MYCAMPAGKPMSPLPHSPLLPGPWHALGTLQPPLHQILPAGMAEYMAGHGHKGLPKAPIRVYPIPRDRRRDQACRCHCTCCAGGVHMVPSPCQPCAVGTVILPVHLFVDPPDTHETYVPRMPRYVPCLKTFVSCAYIGVRYYFGSHASGTAPTSPQRR